MRQMSEMGEVITLERVGSWQSTTVVALLSELHELARAAPAGCLAGRGSGLGLKRNNGAHAMERADCLDRSSCSSKPDR